MKLVVFFRSRRPFKMAKCVSASPNDDSNTDNVSLGASGAGDDDDVCVATKSKKRKIKFVCKDGRQFRKEVKIVRKCGKRKKKMWDR